MSVRPLDLQVNVNSTLQLFQKEGLRISRIETEQKLALNKQNQDYHKTDKKVDLIEELNISNKINQYKLPSDENLNDKNYQKKDHNQIKKSHKSESNQKKAKKLNNNHFVLDLLA